MRLSQLATFTVAVVATAVLAPVATAATSPTLYVLNTAANCNDSGPGASYEPFCTIQAAADVAQPGQTVVVGALGTNGTYAGATITHSGSPGAPITFTTATPWTQAPQSVTVAGALALSGVHDVTIENFSVTNGAVDITVADSSNVTIDHVLAHDGVDISGNSNGVALTRSNVAMRNLRGTSEVTVHGGPTGTVLADDAILAPNATTAITLSGATGTDIVNDSTQNRDSPCGMAIVAGAGSTGTTIENNSIVSCGSAPSVISVAADSTSGSTVDYNDVYSPNAGVLYDWAGGHYASATALQAATGQGAHDLNTDPQTTGLSPTPEGSPLVDSGNDQAPGIPTTDYWGKPREIDDPLVANTGVGSVDRGATERQDPVASTVTMSAIWAPTGGTVTATVHPSSPWSPVTQYRVDFGDGTAAVVSTSPTVQHTYADTGSYTVSAAVTDALGNTGPASTAGIGIDAPKPLTGTLTVQNVGTVGVELETQASDSWDFSGVTYDFGDGTAPVPASVGSGLAHYYAAPGTYTVTATITDSGGNTWTTSQSFATAGARFTPDGPQRVLDTRDGTGAAGPVSDGGTVRLKIGGAGTVPAGATAVALNVTVTDTAAPGYVSVYPDGVARPTVSTLNFTAGQTVANSTMVALSPDGYVDLYDHGGPVDLVADVTGYFVRNAAASGYTTVAPQRLLDTRTSGDALGAGGTLALPVAGAAGLPSTGLTAVAVNVTAVNPTGPGYLTAYPGGVGRPLASTLNFVAGQTVANMAVVPVGQDGTVDFYNGSPGPTDLLVDVVGYFTAGSGSEFAPVTPYRAFDTRQTSPVPARTTVTGTTAPPTGVNPTSGSRTTAVVFNLTVTDTTTPGFLTAYNSAQPATSNLNWAAGQTVPNMAIPNVPGTLQNDTVQLYNGSPTDIDVLGDVLGYFGT